MSFEQQIKEALNILGPKKLIGTIARIQKRRLKPLARIALKAAKKQNGLKKTVKALFDERVKITKPFIGWRDAIVSSKIYYNDEKFNWLDEHKNNVKSVKRKYYGRVIEAEQDVLTKVNVGKGLKKIDGYFIAKAQNSGKRLPFRRRNMDDPKSKLFVPLSNPFRKTILGDKSLQDINNEWSQKTLDQTIKEINRQVEMKKQKEINLKLSA